MEQTKEGEDEFLLRAWKAFINGTTESSATDMVEDEVDMSSCFHDGNVGCNGCDKTIFPNGPCENQGAHMDPGGCLNFDDDDDDDDGDEGDDKTIGKGKENKI